MHPIIYVVGLFDVGTACVYLILVCENECMDVCLSVFHAKTAERMSIKYGSQIVCKLD